MLLNDSQLLRIANSLTIEQVSSLAIKLGASQNKLEELKAEHRLTYMIKFHSLRICRENNKRCCDFLKAMKTADIDIHRMCQVIANELKTIRDQISPIKYKCIVICKEYISYICNFKYLMQ